jgi:hypothetical protein
MRTTLRILLAILGVAAVLIALCILVTGAAPTARLGEEAFDALTGWRGPPSPPWPPTMDNELRFYAALWGAYGLLLLVVARDLGARLSWVPWLAAVFFAGGVGRALSWASVGPPHPFFLALMATELTLPLVLIGLWLAVRRSA